MAVSAPDSTWALPAVVAAPAKLTLSLRVTGVRADGLHELDAEMVTIDLADVLEIDRGAGVSVVDEVVGDLGLGELGAKGDLLVTKALASVGAQVSVRVHKRIPVGAGLGGGSADAGAVLRWSGSKSAHRAARLGSDVPFCLRGGRARVRGVGEIVESLSHLPCSYVLLLPPITVETARVYAAWDVMAARSEEGSGVHGENGNDLEEAAIRAVPELAGWRDALGNVTGRSPRLAGSGSTWFIEGDLHGLGLADRPFLTLRGARAPVVEAVSVPAGWEPERLAGGSLHRGEA